MGISQYPRAGHPIAPFLLREILDVPVPSSLIAKWKLPQRTKLRDLDETVWAHRSPQLCKTLANLVVNQVRLTIVSLPAPIRTRPLPRLPRRKLNDLDLEVRTYNCLHVELSKRRLEDLGEFTIGEVLQIRSFGAKSLVDLLTSLESFIPMVKPELDRALTVEAEKLRQMQHAKVIRCNDPRIGQQLGHLSLSIPSLKRGARAMGVVTLCDIANLLVTREDDPSNPAAVVQQLQEINKCIRALSQMTLEEEIMSLAVAVKDERRARIAVRYFGWDGLGGCTLQALGDQLGLTRERVRQICEKVTRSLKEGKPITPVLTRALMFVAAHTPGSAEEIESKLMSEGFTKQSFRLEGLLRAAEILDCNAAFEIATLREKRFAVPKGLGHLIDNIAQTAKRLVSSQGVVTVADIAARIEGEMSSSVNEDFVVQIVKGEEGFQWLDESSGWFWLSSVPRNRLLNIIEKILSVAGDIEVAELRVGVARVHRMNGFAPPRRVLLELCRQASGYRVEGNTVIADSPFNWEEVLAATERLMVQILREHNSVMQNAEFEKISLDGGINRATFWAYLTYSPVIARYAPGVSGLPGAEVSPGFVESLISKQRKPGRVLKDYGWTADSSIWLGYQLSQAMITSGVFTVPSSMKPFVKGQFILKDNDGSRIGSVVTKETGAWGLGPFFKRRGGEPGDYLVILFNLAIQEAVVRIGDASLFYDFQSIDGDLIGGLASATDVVLIERD